MGGLAHRMRGRGVTGGKKEAVSAEYTEEQTAADKGLRRLTRAPTAPCDPSPQCSAVLYCGESCLRADWRRCPDDVSHRFWCPRLAAFMDRTGELAALPFTYTAGASRRPRRGGRNWDPVSGARAGCPLRGPGAEECAPGPLRARGIREYGVQACATPSPTPNFTF